MRSLRLAILAVVLVALLGVGLPAASGTGSPNVALSKLDGATTPTSFTLDVDVAGSASAKLIIDGKFVGRDDEAPLSFDVSVAAGEHRVKVRPVVDGVEGRIDAAFVASDGATADTAPAPTTAPAQEPITTTTITLTPPPSSTTTSVAVPTTTTAPSSTTTSAPRTGQGEIVVDTVEEVRAAVSGAKPGDVIVVTDGEYTFKPRLVLPASGTASAPVTIRGSRDVVFRTKNASGDYGMHVVGDYWHIEGITVAHGSKGIVMDGSVGTVIDGVEVYDIGAEAIHFRACSSDGVLRDSYVHDTGQTSAQYGEGVYVGSANSNWSQYECADRMEKDPTGDNTERVLIENNVFEDITAEGADLKEGTDSGILRDNVFRRTGTSGQNSADSAVDAKGNNWLIEDNVVSETDAPWIDDGVQRPSEFADGYQSHSVYDGYGTGNLFQRNEVIGEVDGFGVGLYPALGNVVTCDNSAPGAAMGLVGDKSKRSTCQNTQ